MKKILIIVSLIIISLIVYLNFKNDNKIKVELDKCIDGDTAWFKINGTRKKYRFLSIDTMENNTEFGKLTSDYVCNLLNSTSNIKIEYSKFGEEIDKYNRDLVFVYIDNKIIQEKLLEEGYARLKYVYVKYEYIDKFIQAESLAKSKKIGLWIDYKENKEDKYNILDNPKKLGCKFIGWEYNNKFYDMTTKINNKKLEKKFEC